MGGCGPSSPRKSLHFIHPLLLKKTVSYNGWHISLNLDANSLLALPPISTVVKFLMKSIIPHVSRQFSRRSLRYNFILYVLRHHLCFSTYQICIIIKHHLHYNISTLAIKWHLDIYLWRVMAVYQGYIITSIYKDISW